MEDEVKVMADAPVMEEAAPVVEEAVVETVEEVA